MVSFLLTSYILALISYIGFPWLLLFLSSLCGYLSSSYTAGQQDWSIAIFLAIWLNTLSA